MIVYEVYKLKHRGIIATVQDPEIVPSIGSVVYSGDDSWIVRGVEKMHTGCFSFRADSHRTYHLLLHAIGASRDPVPTMMLNVR
jgi:hypothetical protein